MILECNLNTDIEINTLNDLSKLKPLMENGLKTNYSRLARKFDVDRRTVKKYCNGYSKCTTRNKKSKIDDYYDIIQKLLKEATYGNSKKCSNIKEYYGNT